MGVLAGIARRAKKRAPMETLETADISLETGVANDSRGKPGKRQVTLLSARDWRVVCAELGIDVPWTTRRANLFLDDFDLPKEAGRIVEIGSVRLQTTVEVDPCFRMDEQCPGLTKALGPDWRGGVGCMVVQAGTVSIGDKVKVIE